MPKSNGTHTNVECFRLLLDVVTKYKNEIAESDELSDFLILQIMQLEKKKERAQAKAAANKKPPLEDPITKLIADCLNFYYQDANQLLNKIFAITKDDSLTRAKISARASKLVEIGVAKKGYIDRDGKRVVGYRAMTAT